MHFSPITSDAGLSSTAETTPIGTPRGFGALHLRRPEKERDNPFSWHRTTTDIFAGNTGSYVNSTLLETELEESTFPLFVDPMGGHDMTTSMSSPIDIARPARNGSVSPRTHLTSNLTSALQSTSGNEARATPAMNISNGNTKGVSNGFGHQDSLTGGAPTVGSHWAGGAQPISMVNSNRKDSRRESIAGSLVGGMSWGGVSVGSWIRDEYDWLLALIQDI